MSKRHNNNGKQHQNYNNSNRQVALITKQNSMPTTMAEFTNLTKSGAVYSSIQDLSNVTSFSEWTFRGDEGVETVVAMFIRGIGNQLLIDCTMSELETKLEEVLDKYFMRFIEVKNTRQGQYENVVWYNRDDISGFTTQNLFGADSVDPGQADRIRLHLNGSNIEPIVKATLKEIRELTTAIEVC